MGNRFNRSWTLVKESYSVLKSTPGLAFFPIISSIACLIATISFFLPLAVTGAIKSHGNTQSALYYICLFGFYFVTSFIVIFFNSGLVSCAHDALNGRPTTYHDGLKNATKRLGPILLWSLVSASVGLILRMISERVGFVGKLIVAILGGAWSLITYFVIPIIVVEGTAPFPAIKKSGAMLKATWGELIIGAGSMGIVFFLLSMIGLVPLGIGIAAGANGLWPIMVPLIIVAILYWVTLAVISTTLNGIFNTALYVFASSGQVPVGYTEEYVRMAFVQKKKSRMFGGGM